MYLEGGFRISSSPMRLFEKCHSVCQHVPTAGGTFDTTHVFGVYELSGVISQIRDVDGVVEEEAQRNNISSQDGHLVSCVRVSRALELQTVRLMNPDDHTPVIPLHFSFLISHLSGSFLVLH